MLQANTALARIGVMNNIAKAGLDVFNGAYRVGKDVSSADALIVRSAKINTADHPGVFAIARAGIGVNTITVDDATQRGICVFNTPGANARAVAEIVMTMIGAESRQIFPAVQFVRSLPDLDDAQLDQMVEKEKSKFVGHELAGKVLGVIGLGKIGVLVANLGLQKGMKVVGYDSFLTVPNALQLSHEVNLAKSIDQVLSAADIVTLHVPYNPDTKHLIDDVRLVLLKDGAVLANFARKEICDDEAVLAALQNGKLRTYITDFPTSRYKNHPKVIPTPHLGASTEESEDNCAIMAAKQLRDFFENGTVINSVNFPTCELVPDRAVRTRLVVVNRDTPGMIASITTALSRDGINISRSRNESNGTIGYNLVDVNDDVPPHVIAKILQVPDILKVRAIPMNR